MALVNPYCSLWDVQKELHNEDADNSEWIETCIVAASRFVDEWRGRDYFQHDYTSTALVMRGGVDPDVFDEWLFLPYSPIIGTLTEVKDGGVVLVAGTDYVIHKALTDMKRDALLRVNGSWELGIMDSDATQIKGLFGYAQAATTDVPTGIPVHVSKATILLAAAFSTMEQKDIIGADGMRDRLSSKSIPPQVATLLGPKHGRVLV